MCVCVCVCVCVCSRECVMCSCHRWCLCDALANASRLELSMAWRAPAWHLPHGVPLVIHLPPPPNTRVRCRAHSPKPAATGRSLTHALPSHPLASTHTHTHSLSLLAQWSSGEPRSAAVQLLPARAVSARQPVWVLPRQGAAGAVCALPAGQPLRRLPLEPPARPRCTPSLSLSHTQRETA